jgi:hypothetical protein
MRALKRNELIVYVLRTILSGQESMESDLEAQIRYFSALNFFFSNNLPRIMQTYKTDEVMMDEIETRSCAAG